MIKKLVILVLWLLPTTLAASIPPIVLTPAAPDLVRLAALETQRYLYLRLGALPEIKPQMPPAGDQIVIATKTQSIVNTPAIQAPASALGPAEFLIKTTTTPHTRIWWIVGGDEIGTLYGAYHFIEKLGVRFYLHGDVVPDQRLTAIPPIDELQKPLFAIRGIQPFHDFPEGPDWWNQEDYLAYLSQLAKMRMNFLGLHCYPEAAPHPEPLVWIGLPTDHDAAGQVTFAYPAMWANTRRDAHWGYQAMPTDDFCAGASQLFPASAYGPTVQQGLMPQPENTAAACELFNRTGKMFARIFSHARLLGVKTCIGAETPLTIPKAVQQRLQTMGLDPTDSTVVRQLYHGIFGRLLAAGAPDYYWFWTPEGWTWGGNKPEEFNNTLRDLRMADQALTQLGRPLTLATCGWVLGPQHDRTALDKYLPKIYPMSCINRDVGHAPVEPFFANLQSRPKWAIPWLENDPNLIAYQPWVGRMRRDASDALRLGCTGLIGIHWRTKILAQNVAALAQAAWDQSWIPSEYDRSPAPPIAVTEQKLRGNVASFSEPVAGTDLQAIYQTVRYGMDQYMFEVPNGTYTLTLQFNEPFYLQAGKRVLAVRVNGATVIPRLDIYEQVGQNQALDFTLPGIVVTQTQLVIDFVPIVEFPCIAGLVLRGEVTPADPLDVSPYLRRINCGGLAVADYEADTLPIIAADHGKARTMPVQDFYLDFARAWFGPEIATPAGEILAQCDGLNAIEPSTWKSGPGAIKMNPNPWRQEKANYQFVTNFVNLRSRVRGRGNLARFDSWSHLLQFHAGLGELGCQRGELDAQIDLLKREPEVTKRQLIARQALTIREDLARLWERTMRTLLAAVDTPGELGTLANLEQHNRGTLRFLTQHDSLLTNVLGNLPASVLHLDSVYHGPARSIVPTVRTQIAPGEALPLKVILLSSTSPASARLYWRPLGKGKFQSLELKPVGRAVYQVQLPPLTESFEYYLQAEVHGSRPLFWPATAPALNQTVVVW